MADPRSQTDREALAALVGELAQVRRELRAQQQLVAQQSTELASQRAQLDAMAGAVRPTTCSPPAPPPGRQGWTRRALLLGGVGAVAGAATMATAGPAHATSGAMLFGAGNNAGSDPTSLTSTSLVHTLRVNNTSSGPSLWGSATSAGGVVGTSDTGTGVLGDSPSGSGVVGMSHTGHGVRGTSDTFPGVEGDSDSYCGVVGYSPHGMAARFSNGGTVGPPSTGTWQRGCLYAPSDGSVWWCVANGTPGTWRMLAAAESTGAFVPVTPTRVYDSRAPKPSAGAILVAGSFRDISVANGRDLFTGAITVPNLMPIGVRAVSLNLTVAGGTGTGTVALAPGGTATYTASAINFEAGQRLANGLVTPINPTTRAIRAFAITSNVHVIIDVMGFFR
ncbi:MAG: hypothetical protein QG597_4618 [Actinomycetota bacterium]|nr:hypothetical protein [Actinomycetota bacterium]